MSLRSNPARRTLALLILAGAFLLALAPASRAQTAPVVTGVSTGSGPAAGPVAGGTTVTITGSGFTGVSEVDFGSGNPSPSVTFNSDSSITAVAPPGSAGPVDVLVIANGDTSSPNPPADQFTYDTTPVVTGVSPSSGPASGGNTVTINGSGFDLATSVNFGPFLSVPVTPTSDGQLTVTAPDAGLPEQVDVTVTSTVGTSALAPPQDQYSFISAPAVASVSPSSGPEGGGNSVKILGSNLAGATAVDFGSTPASSFSADPSGDFVTATAPAGTGTVDVTVTTQAGGTSAINQPGDEYTYLPAPTVSGISTTLGPTSGGTAVTITGTGFIPGQDTVKFGTQVASITGESTTSITATSPAESAGTVDVTVTNPGGTSATSSADQFTYVAPPQIANLTPPSGPLGGGTQVTITGSNFEGTTAVYFGSVNATADIVSVNNTTIVVDSPARSTPGTVYVTVTAIGGTSGTGGSAEAFTYVSAPAVTGVSPDAGPVAGGTAVTITGTGFSSTPSVSFGGTPVPANDISFASDTKIILTTPPGSPGTVDVTVTSADGTSATGPADEYTYEPPPTVTLINPTSGPTAGGNPVTITGTNFVPGNTTVQFGSADATITGETDTSIAVTAPAGGGTVNVTVTTPGGTSSASGATQQYTYEGVPTVTKVRPNAGPTGGGNSVTIEGTGFISGSTTVNFGSAQATITAETGTSITVDAPGGSGTVDVTVTTPGGTSQVTSSDRYTYDVQPFVDTVSPSAGPTAGGNPVTIAGNGFISGATTVQFGAADASITSQTDTSITVEAPAGSGTVNVTVTTPGGTSDVTGSTTYTYDPQPTVTGINPTAGPLGGDNSVTISGTGLSGATSVDFGSAAATITGDTDTSITVVTPAGSGTVNVTVTTPGGTSQVTGSDQQYTYVGQPAVLGVSPDEGPSAGGNPVTISGTGFVSGATTVQFNGADATVTAVTSNSITVDAPAGSGTVDVTVITPGGTSAINRPADEYTYFPAPTVTQVYPSQGPASGVPQQQVTITGTNFIAGSTTVSFGTQTVPIDTLTSSSITVTAPGGSGTVDVTVTTPGGTSATSLADQYTFDPQPTVTQIAPNAGPLAGGTSVTITGTGFVPGYTTVAFGGSPAQVTNVTSSTITATSPGGNGTVPIIVSTPGGTSPNVGADLFTYTTGPTVASISPAVGPAAGGNVVTINGSGFGSKAGATVMFGKVPALSVTYISATQLTAVAPPQAVGTSAHIEVSTLFGSSPTSSADLYTYVPIVSSIGPNVGPVAGGTRVAISGSGFSSSSAVYFGTNHATASVQSTTSITATAPAGSAGTVDITVITNGATSPTSSADQFTYEPVPEVSQVAPASGPPSGGTTVTISGSGFTSGSTVAFGGVAAASVAVDSSTQLTAVSPGSGSVGTVDITVTTIGGTSPTSANDQFTYTFQTGSPPVHGTLPSVDSVAPAAGPLAGGTSVTINGSDFTGASAVYFGSAPAASFQVVSGTEIIATSPAGSPGEVTVTVTTSAGNSPPGAGSLFTYAIAPTVVDVRVGSLARNSSTVAATIDDGGLPLTGCEFQYGRTERYGQSVVCSSETVSANGIVSLSGGLKGLAAGTVYHYRVAVTTAGGSAASADQSFTTGDLPLLQAPLVGLVVERVLHKASTIGSLLGINGIEDGIAGESITIRCLRGCPHRTVLTLNHIKRPARVHATLAHALSLTTKTRIEILVSKSGQTGRFAVYAFTTKKTALSVSIVATGCLNGKGGAIACPAPSRGAKSAATFGVRLYSPGQRP